MERNRKEEMSTEIESKNKVFLKIIEYEQLLNSHSGKRYHITTGNDMKTFSLLQVNRNNIDKILITDLNAEEMLRWIERHLVVDIVIT